MSFDQSSGGGTAGLSLNFGSNNPFRNRAVSPLPAGQRSPNDPPPRPVSRNPFLDDAQLTKENVRPPRMPSPDKTEVGRDTLTGNAADIFDALTLEDNDERPRPPARTQTESSVSTRQEMLRPKGPPTHRSSRSQEQSRRAPPVPSRTNKDPAAQLDIFASSPEKVKLSEQRLRRNSDSSLMERPKAKTLDAEEEKKRQERRRRERERRHRDRDGDKDARPKKPSRKLDIIDQLDATSIYGTGLFHHDGPFDACNPHRNRAGSRRAPMQAFPKDSLNNVLGGSGPLNKRPDHTQFMGQSNDEAFTDYSRGGDRATAYGSYNSRPVQPGVPLSEANVQSSLQKVEPIHGDESMGLGTSTFLEGAPASRAAIQKTEAENAAAAASGLQRKKSLAQKIRGISNTRRDFGPGPPGRIVSAEPRYSPTSPTLYTPNGTRLRAQERNPFFNEYDADKKESINVVRPGSSAGRARAPSSPGLPSGGPLERRTTTDSIGVEAPKQSTGFLSRVKSLKGGPRRPKTEKPVFE